MTLLDRFRRRPPWEDPDPEVRAEAVRHMDAHEQERLGAIARHDADARVRRAAGRRLTAPAALAALAAEDPDASVREEATGALVALAMGENATAAEAAVAALSEARQLVTLARSAILASVRREALSRITDARHLAILAKTAEDPAIRLEALRRVEEPALLLEVAARSEHKDVAVGAVERIKDAEALREVASRARNRAAARRARAKLEAAQPGLPPEPALVEPPPPESAAPAPAVHEPTLEPTPLATSPSPPPIEPPPSEPAAAAATEAPVEEAPVNAPPREEARKEEAEAPVESGPREAEARRGKPARMEELCARLEALAKAQNLTLREGQAALRDARHAQDDFGALPGRLRQRLKVARGALFARVQELREADEWSRWGNATVQEELCQLMESLVAREDLERVARELRAADARWAEVRYAPRDQAEGLRQRYQAARTQVKSRLDAYFARKAQEEAENLRQKEALCERAEALADSTDWLKAGEELKALQARWKQIGPTSRRHSEAVWRRFRAACDRFFTRRGEDLRRRKAEWAANLARKKALCERAEALSTSSDWEAAAAEIRRLQSEWKGVGPVARNKSEEVWQRFRKACDAFFERYKRRDELELAARRAEWEAVCRELEALLPPAEELHPALEGLSEKVQALQARLRHAPSLPSEDHQALTTRFLEARNRLVESYPEGFRGTDLDPEVSRAKKERLCARVEALLSGAEEEGVLTGEALARRLKEALAANTLGRGDGEAQRRREIAEVEAAQAAWKRLGPVPGVAGAGLEERFRSACARFFEARRAGAGRRPRHPALT